jgi:class 3 adenylate cyclase
MATTRTVTVLFTDLVGSTELTSGLDPASADKLRARHFSGLRAALAVHRGQEVKTLGDGFMAIFDGAGDGLGCAVTMQRGIRRENGGHPEAELAMRVGVATGEVTCDAGDYFGLPVIQASRLCAAAGPGQILTTDLVQMLVGRSGIHELVPAGVMTLKGLPEPVTVWEVTWDSGEEFALRVALADDSVLLRAGIAQVLEADGVEVVLQAGDAETLLEMIPGARPHVAVLDVRMPPTHTTEGLEAAVRIRAEHPEIGVLVLSAEVHTSAARMLLAGGTNGIGYLLKERVGDMAELIGAIRTLASGGSAIDPALLGELTAA